MELKGEAKLLRIFLGESDKAKHTPLYDVIVREAKDMGLAGATVWRGIEGFGATSRIRTSRILDLSTDLPIIVEIVDLEEKIDRFLPKLHDLFESVGCGGLITIEKVQIIKVYPRKRIRLPTRSCDNLRQGRAYPGRKEILPAVRCKKCLRLAFDQLETPQAALMLPGPSRMKLPFPPLILQGS